MATAKSPFELLLVLLLLAVVPSSCINDDVTPANSIVMVGDEIPDFSVTLDNGLTVSSANLRGKMSVIVFFTTGCNDCRKLLPVIQDLHERLSDLTIICIAREESDTEIRQYWHENSLTLNYSPQSDRSVFNLFATEGVPRVYVVDDNLRVTAMFDDSELPTLDELLRLCDLSAQ